MAFPVKTKKKPKNLGEVAMGRKKNKNYFPDDTGHMVEWVGDHPIGTVPEETETEEDKTQDGNFTMGQSGG
jgi:hypothetical protein